MSNREVLEQNNQELSNIKSSINILKVYDISDATAKSNDILNGKTAYTCDGKVTGELIINEHNNSRLDNYGGGQINKYFTEIPLLNTSNVTNMSQMFEGCTNLTTIPLLNTSNVTDMSRMFYKCSNLITIPQLDTSKVTNMYMMFCDCNRLVDLPILDISKSTNMQSMFVNCNNLSDESLNNILTMCINATSYITQGTNMTLSYIGLPYSQRTKCTTLSNYQAFLDAGWTT